MKPGVIMRLHILVQHCLLIPSFRFICSCLQHGANELLRLHLHLTEDLQGIGKLPRRLCVLSDGLLEGSTVVLKIVDILEVGRCTLPLSKSSYPQCEWEGRYTHAQLRRSRW